MREGDDGDGGFRARKLSMSRLRYGRWKGRFGKGLGFALALQTGVASNV